MYSEGVWAENLDAKSDTGQVRMRCLVQTTQMCVPDVPEDLLTERDHTMSGGG